MHARQLTNTNAQNENSCHRSSSTRAITRTKLKITQRSCACWTDDPFAMRKPLTWKIQVLVRVLWLVWLDSRSMLSFYVYRAWAMIFPWVHLLNEIKIKRTLTDGRTFDGVPYFGHFGFCLAENLPDCKRTKIDKWLFLGEQDGGQVNRKVSGKYPKHSRVMCVLFNELRIYQRRIAYCERYNRWMCSESQFDWIESVFPLLCIKLFKWVNSSNPPTHLVA